MFEKILGNGDKIIVKGDGHIIPEISTEDMVLELPSFKLKYVLSFDELTKIISKEVKLYDWFDMIRIPKKDDSITFGDEIDADCGFIVESVSRSQDKNEILIIGKHYGHDSGLVYDKMIEKHGFQ